MFDRDPDPGGSFGVLDGGALLNESRETLPSTPFEALETHLPTDTCTDSDAGEAFEAWLLGGSLELRVQLLEENVRKAKENNYKFTKAMNRCVIVRDEQINAQRSEIENKDQVIAEMKVKIVANETKIDELLKKKKTLEERTNRDSLRMAEGTP